MNEALVKLFLFLFREYRKVYSLLPLFGLQSCFNNARQRVVVGFECGNITHRYTLYILFVYID
jgi:hypothetical protein